MKNVLAFKIKREDGVTRKESLDEAMHSAVTKATVEAFKDLIASIEINVGDDYTTVGVHLTREITQEEYNQRANVQ